MMDINPLDVLNKRALKWMPPHFSKIKLSANSLFLTQEIENWIKYKLKGRYCLVNKPESTGMFTFVGFEEEKELTYFMLACTHIRSQ